MGNFLKLTEGMLINIRLPYSSGEDAPLFLWQVGQVVEVGVSSVRIGVVDMRTFELLRIVEFSRCSLKSFCSLRIDILLPH